APPGLPLDALFSLAILGSYLILLARFPITPLMLLPRVPKMPTTASAIKAAATAYSESSRPVSSRRKFLIIFLLLRFGLRVKPFALTLTTLFEIGGRTTCAENQYPELIMEDFG